MTWPWAGPVSPQWWHMLSPAPCTSYRFADLPQPIHLGGFEGGCCAMRAHQKQINNMSNIILSVCVRQVLSGWVGCCILLCCAVLCTAVHCCALLCCAVHCCAVHCCAVHCCAGRCHCAEQQAKPGTARLFQAVQLGQLCMHSVSISLALLRQTDYCKRTSCRFQAT